MDLISDINLLLKYILKTYQNVKLPDQMTLDEIEFTEVDAKIIFQKIQNQKLVDLNELKPKLPKLPEKKNQSQKDLKKLPPVPQKLFSFTKNLPPTPKEELSPIPSRDAPKKPTDSPKLQELTPKIQKISLEDDLEISKVYFETYIPKEKLTSEAFLKIITREIEHKQDPLYTETKFEFTYEDIQKISYEYLLLYTKFLTEASKEVLELILGPIRENYKISAEEHASILESLISNPDDLIKINTQVDTKFHKKGLNLLTKKFPSEILLLSHRIAIINKKGEKEFQKRNLIFLYNCLVVLIRQCYKEDWEYQKKKYSSKEMENLLNTSFETYFKDNSFNIQSLSTFILEELKYTKSLKIPHPIHLRIYETLSEIIYYPDMESSEIESMKKILKEIKELLQISDHYLLICKVSCLFNFAKNCGDIREEKKLENSLMVELEALLVKKTTDDEAKRYLIFLINSILKSYCKHFIDLLDYYVGDNDTLENHFEIYHLSLDLWCSVLGKETTERKSLTADCYNLILQQTMEKNYIGIKSLKKKESELATLVNMIQTLDENISSHLKYLVPIFQIHNSQAKKRLLFIILALFVEDVKRIIPTEKELTEEVIEICRFIKQNISKYQMTREIWDQINFSQLLSKPIKNWNEKVKTSFSTFYNNSLKLEEWKSISQEIPYSHSAVDLFSFIDTAAETIHSIILPGTHGIVNDFIENAYSMIQQYIQLNTQDFPVYTELYPTIPRLNSQKILTVLSNKILGNDTKKDVLQKKIDKFTFLLANVRLNNILYVREKFKNLVNGIKEIYIENQSFIPELPNIDFDIIVKKNEKLVKECLEKICLYIACRNVFIELNSVFSQIYTPTVKECTVRSISDQFLGTFIKATRSLVINENVANFIILETFKNIIFSLSIIILDGGSRTFSPSDTIEILYDILTLEDLFFENGRYIKSKKFITRCTSRLKSKFH